MYLSSFIILKLLSSITDSNVMAFIQKLLRSKKVNVKNDCSEIRELKPLEDLVLTETKQNGVPVDDTDTDSDEENQKEALLSEMRHQLKILRRHEERRRRRQADVMAMEAEIQQLVSMISRCQLHSLALDEELMNKKCEIKFLQSEGPDDHEMHLQVKKNQPVLYKKYNNIKGSNEAKSLLSVIRQSQRALQYLELMTYNRYLERQHGIHLDPVRKRTNLLLKDKVKNFGHLVDSLQAKKLSLKKIEPRTSSPIRTETSEANNSSEPTFITVTSSLTTPTHTSGFTFGLPLLTMQRDSSLTSGSGTAASIASQIPINPFETSL